MSAIKGKNVVYIIAIVLHNDPVYINYPTRKKAMVLPVLWRLWLCGKSKKQLCDLCVQCLRVTRVNQDHANLEPTCLLCAELQQFMTQHSDVGYA